VFSQNVFLEVIIIFRTSLLGSGAAWKKFDELKSPIRTFYITQSFLFRDPFGFWSFGYPGVMLVLRTFPELVMRTVQNLVEIDPAVQA